MTWLHRALTPTQIHFLYDSVRKWFVSISYVLVPTTFVIDAPFGRFAPAKDFLTVDGLKSWIVMELISPICFAIAFFSSPFTAPGEPISYSTPQLILAGAYFIHYTNRAIISPLRTPSRSKTHLIVPLMGLFFNVPNGSLLGTYISAPSTQAYLAGIWHSPRFYIGLSIWLLGLIGNIAHDEILINIRKDRNRAIEKKTDGYANGHSNGHANGNGHAKVSKKEHYAIPHGLLFRYVSFPNYFCEWVEWFGWALAAAPFPIKSLSELNPTWIFSAGALERFIKAPPSSFAPLLTPPFIFLLNELLLMFPRAYKGHQWYKTTFGDAFPKNRKIVIPFLL